MIKTFLIKIHLVFENISASMDRIIVQLCHTIEEICKVGFKALALVLLYKLALGDLMTQFLSKL